MLIAVVAAAFLQQTAVQAAPQEQPRGAETAATTPAPREDDPLDRVVCRTEAVVGSRFNSRVCMTRREWDQRRDESRRLAHRLDVQNSNRDRVTAPGH